MEIEDKRYYKIKEKILPYMVYASQDVANTLRTKFIVLRNGKKHGNMGLLMQAYQEITEIFENKENFPATKLSEIKHFINEEMSYEERFEELENEIANIQGKKRTVRTKHKKSTQILKEEEHKLNIDDILIDIPDEFFSKINEKSKELPGRGKMNAHVRYTSSKVRWDLSVLISEQINKTNIVRNQMIELLETKVHSGTDQSLSYSSWKNIIDFSICGLYDDFPEELCKTTSFSVLACFFHVKNRNVVDEGKKLIMNGTINSKESAIDYIQKKKLKF